MTDATVRADLPGATGSGGSIPAAAPAAGPAAGPAGGPTAAPALPELRTPEQRRTLGLASLSTVLALMAFVTPLATGSRTAAALGSGPSTVPWLLSAMALGLAVALLPSGALADDLGRRRVLVVGLALVAAGSVLCASASASLLFVAGRLVTGLGGAAVLACGLGLIGHAFPPGPARGAATGVWGASVGGGIATGGLLTVLADPGSSWRGTYVVLAVLAALLAVAGRLLLVESTALVRRRPDLLGAALLAAALAALLTALVQARTGSGAVLAALSLAGAALLAAFVLVELRSSAPMLDLGLLRRRPFLAASVGAFTNGVSATALAAFTPTLLQRGLGRSLLAASLLSLLFAGTSVLAALQVKRLPVRWTSRHLMVGGLVGIAVGQLVQAGLTTGSSVGRLVPGALLTGIAFGVLNATVGREAVASVPPDRTAMGSGANNTFRYVGSALGITLVTVVATRDAAGGAAALVAGWDDAVLLTAALSLAGAAVIAAVRPAR